MPGQAHPLKIRIEGPFDHFIICQCSQHILRNAFPRSQVNHLNLTAIHRIAKQQDLKVR